MRVFDLKSSKSIVSREPTNPLTLDSVVNVKVESYPSSVDTGRERNITRRSTPSIANSFSRPSNSSDLAAPERFQNVTMYGCVKFNPNSRWVICRPKGHPHGRRAEYNHGGKSNHNQCVFSSFFVCWQTFDTIRVAHWNVSFQWANLFWIELRMSLF